MSPGAHGNTARFPRQRVRLPYPRSNSGCLVCRRQRKKCDERRPTCSRCLFNGKACQWPVTVPRETDSNCSRSLDNTHPTNDIPVDANPYGEQIHSPTSPLNRDAAITGDGLPVTEPQPFSLDPISSMFLAHFVAETSKHMITVGPVKNLFLTYMLPLAFSDELILHSLLALGGAHLERKQSSPEIDTCVCRHYGLVIHRLQEIITRKQNEPIEWLRALLALLIIYVTGVCPSASIFSIYSGSC